MIKIYAVGPPNLECVSIHLTVDKIFWVTRLTVLLYRYMKLHITLQNKADGRCSQLYMMILTWQNPHQLHNSSKIPLSHYWLIVSTLNLLEMNLTYMSTSSIYFRMFYLSKWRNLMMFFWRGECLYLYIHSW